MTELISNNILKEKMLLLFGDTAEVTSNKDEVTIKDGEIIYKLEFDEEELNSELNAIIQKGPYFTLIEGQFNFILKDINSNLSDVNVLDIVGELSDTIRIRIKRDKRAYGLLINNLEFVSDKSGFTAGETHTLDDIIDDSIIICEVTLVQGTEMTEEQIDCFIDSIRAHLSFSNNILLENPRENKINQRERDNIKTDRLRVNLIRDNEPLTYFLFAESVEHLHLKYLEYYHVLEYYFLHKRIKDVEKVIKNLLAIEMTKRITDDKQEYYKDLIGLFDSYFRKEDKNSAEIEQLEYVITSDLGYDLIRHALNNSGNILSFLSEDACEIKGTKLTLDKSIFRGRELLGNQDIELTDKFCEQLAKRIYQVRNFIVHSKKYERGRVFVPNAKNLETLANEVKLIRVIAYTMLNRAL